MNEFGASKTMDSPLDAAACHRCRFWDVVSADSAEAGLCRRSAPHEAGWPVTGRLEWCGDFRPASSTFFQRILSVLMLALGVVVFCFLIAMSLIHLRS
ncbi:MAG: hypothetical protein ACKOPE_07925 [Novosphingobium sp.]